MNKYINANELKLILNREHLNYSQMIEKKFVLNAIDKMPSADVAEVKHGEWINKRTMVHDGEFYCSACDFVLDTFMQAVFYNYCPNCGADMRERKETE